MKTVLIALLAGLSAAACAHQPAQTAQAVQASLPSSPSLAPGKAVQGQPITMGVGHVLHSAILGEDRRINVWAPPVIEEGETFTTIYLLDGGVDQDFPHIAGLGQLGALSWTFERVIIVGVETDDRQHELTPPPTDARFIKGFPTAGGDADFRAFITGEVAPFIEAAYPAGKRRALMGESLAGLFVIDTLLDAPDAFDDFIAISPSLWWDNKAPGVGAGVRLAAHDLADKRLYLAMANEGGTMQAATDALLSALEASRLPRFTWRHDDLSETETHATIYHGAALTALRWLYPLPHWEGDTPWFMIEGASPPED